MIWPTGPPRRLKSLAAYDSPENTQQQDPFLHFAIAKTHFFGAFVTRHSIALYRIKPFVPTNIYTLESAEFSHVCIAPTGRFLAALSGSSVHIFRVNPTSFGRVLDSSTRKDTGQGEALGIRELQLEPLKVIECPGVVALCPFKNYLFLVSDSLHFTPWADPTLQVVETGESLEGIKVASASSSPLLSRLSFITSTGSALLVHLTPEALRTYELPAASAERPIATCFNSRYAKVALIYQTQILLYNVKDPYADPKIIPLANSTLGQIHSLEWTLTGKALAIAHSKGWLLISFLGNILFLSDSPALHCEFSVGGDELLLLVQGKVLIYNLTRAYFDHSGSALLLSENRIRLHLDRIRRVFPSDPWQTVPIPNSYLAMNWPITSAATNGRFVALAGAYGLLYMSTLEHQWKVFANPDIMVRQNGIQWYNENLLLLSVLTDSNQRRIELYSTATAGAKVSDHEEELLAGIDLESTVIAMHASEKHKALALYLQNGTFQKYTIEQASLDLVSEDNLHDLFKQNGNVSSISIISEDRTLFLVDETLLEVTRTDSGFLSRTVHSDVEYYYLRNDEVWLFDGSEMVVVGLDHHRKYGIELEAYPISTDNTKGIICTTRAFELQSSDCSYNYIEPQMDSIVYLPRLYEVTDITTSELAAQYGRLEFFDGVLESILYHALVSSRDLGEIVATIKDQCDWQALLARCARKSETKYWQKLFDSFQIKPEVAFSHALDADRVDLAAEYLNILQAQFKADPGDANMVQLFKKAYEAENVEVCKQLAEFLVAIDPSGKLLRGFVQALDIQIS